MAQSNAEEAKRLKLNAQRQLQRKRKSQAAQGKGFETSDHSAGVIPEDIWQGMKAATPNLEKGSAK